MNMRFIAVLLAAGIVLGDARALAQEGPAYPDRTVRVVIPYVPGGQSDTLARAIAQKLMEKWGKPVVVENRPGANGIIGAEFTAKAAPDGYTLLIAEGAVLTINPGLYDKLPYDPVRDFAPITTLTSYGTMLVVHPSVPAKSLSEFIAFVKARPGALTYGSFGTGSGAHLSMESFKLLEGLDIVHVPYKGSTPAVADLLAGRISAVFISTRSIAEYVKSGRLRALGFADGKRSPILPQVPTFAEAGVTGFDATSWFCMVAPGGTPRAITGKIRDEVERIIHEPNFKEQWFTKQGLDAVGDTPEQLEAVIRSEIPKWARVIKAARVKLD